MKEIKEVLQKRGYHTYSDVFFFFWLSISDFFAECFQLSSQSFLSLKIKILRSHLAFGWARAPPLRYTGPSERASGATNADF